MKSIECLEVNRMSSVSVFQVIRCNPRLQLELKFVIITYSPLSLTLNQFLLPTRPHRLDFQEPNGQNSWRLRVGSSLARFRVLQGSYSSQNIGHAVLSYSNHQRCFMVTPLGIQCHLIESLHTKDGYPTCFLGLVPQFQYLISPYTPC